MVCADGRKFSILTLKNDPISDYFCPKKWGTWESESCELKIPFSLQRTGGCTMPPMVWEHSCSKTKKVLIRPLRNSFSHIKKGNKISSEIIGGPTWFGPRRKFWNLRCPVSWKTHPNHRLLDCFVKWNHLKVALFFVHLHLVLLEFCLRVHLWV